MNKIRLIRGTSDNGMTNRAKVLSPLGNNVTKRAINPAINTYTIRAHKMGLRAKMRFAFERAGLFMTDGACTNIMCMGVTGKLPMFSRR